MFNVGDKIIYTEEWLSANLGFYKYRKFLVVRKNSNPNSWVKLRIVSTVPEDYLQAGQEFNLWPSEFKFFKIDEPAAAKLHNHPLTGIFV